MTHPLSEFEIYDRFHNWLKDTQSLVDGFRSAGLPVPPPLARVLGLAGSEGGATGDRLAIPDEKPNEYRVGWVWFPLSDATPTTLVLGILRSKAVPLHSAEVVRRVRDFGAEFHAGTIYNLAKRLDGSKIRRGEGGWSVIDPSECPIITERFAWGMNSWFTKQEVAAHRRLWVRHLLHVSVGGLMESQILRRLEQVDGLNFPVAKTLVKKDMESMRLTGEIVKVGGSRKWKLTK